MERLLITISPTTIHLLSRILASLSSLGPRKACDEVATAPSTGGSTSLPATRSAISGTSKSVSLGNVNTREEIGSSISLDNPDEAPCVAEVPDTFWKPAPLDRLDLPFLERIR
ncbi:unnamed protein product [Protopolystoma xenopodis]|uniref:Uncharacterized protein n=1 Tax=Protopolystoma xenopodis TaxID=117903 RepID=A0A448X2H9_9PLAT|nr:unnamed protein product [Protopolystoma xenopodis]